MINLNLLIIQYGVWYTIGLAVFQVSLSQASICFTCSDAIGSTGCTHMKQCNPGEICFTASISADGNTTAEKGCLPSEFCRTQSRIKRDTSHVTCMECCEEDLCNKETCGATTNTTTTTTARPIGWSSWSSWTSCPYTCGKDGIQHRVRQCTRPDTGVAEDYCTGKAFDTRICHTLVCCTGPPVITYIENSTFATPGDFLSLTCTAINYDSLLWEVPKIVGQPYPANVNHLGGTNTVAITNIGQENKGTYDCVVKNSCGTAVGYVNVTLS